MTRPTILSPDALDSLKEFDLGDSSLAVGEDMEFPDIDDPCDHSPTGQHVYGGPGDCECRYCRKPSGLDR